MTIIQISDQRKPLSKIGGKESIAGFAITKPKPNKMGTRRANNSISYWHIIRNFKYLNKLNISVFLRS